MVNGEQRAVNRRQRLATAHCSLFTDLLYISLAIGRKRNDKGIGESLFLSDL